MAGAAGDVRDRVLTVPNALSVLRLVLVPVFLYLLLVIARQRLGGRRADVQRVLRLGRRQDRADGRQPVVAAGGVARPGRRPHLHGDRACGTGDLRRGAVVDRGHAARPRRRAGRDAAGAAQPRTDRAAGHLHRQGRHLRPDVGLPADPARPVGRAVEPRRPCVRMGVLDLGHGHVSVVGGAVPGSGDDGGAATAQGSRSTDEPLGRRAEGTEHAGRLRPGRRPQHPRGRQADADPFAVAAALPAVRSSRSGLCRSGGGESGRREGQDVVAGVDMADRRRAGDRGGVRRSGRTGTLNGARCARNPAGAVGQRQIRGSRHQRRDRPSRRPGRAGGRRAAQPARRRRTRPSSCWAASTRRTSRRPPRR